MNDTETVISQGMLLSAAQFAPIFAKAWYVILMVLYTRRWMILKKRMVSFALFFPL